MTAPKTSTALRDEAEAIADEAPLIEAHPPIVRALAAVAGDVREVRKTGTNTSQNFNFRGIDAVVNAVGPAFRNHGVVCLPIVEDVRVEPMALSGGKQATRVVVTVRYRFHGPAGDYLEAVSVGEAFDMGDKATAKAMSVAYRTCLLQALTIPTDDPDPDEHSYEQAPPAPPPWNENQAKAHVLALASASFVEEGATEVTVTTDEVKARAAEAWPAIKDTPWTADALAAAFDAWVHEPPPEEGEGTA